MARLLTAVLLLTCLASSQASLFGSSKDHAGLLKKMKNKMKSLNKLVQVSKELSVEAQFEAFKAKHGVSYADDNEHTERFAVFKDNVAKIADLNQEHAGKTTFAVNQFADRTEEEFAAFARCRQSNTTFEGPDYYPLKATASLVKKASVDWVELGAVTPVKNQGQCGSCWSFGTTGVIEGAWKLAGNELISLSEQELVSCDSTDSGCNGGLQSRALAWVERNGGITSEDNYPYTSGMGRAASCENSKKTPIAASIKSWANVKPANAEGLEAAVAEQPVTVAVNAGTSVFQFYNGGIMTGTTRTCNPNLLDHAVLAVGYGTESGTDYWKVKNSWDTTWGEDGYFRIEKGSNTCGIESDAQIATA